MIIESGVLVFIGLMLLFIKLPRRTVCWLIDRPLLMDTSVSIIVFTLHWGTFSGVMAATVAGLLTSGFSSCAGWYIHHVGRERFIHGANV